MRGDDGDNDGTCGIGISGDGGRNGGGSDTSVVRHYLPEEGTAEDELDTGLLLLLDSVDPVLCL